MEFRFVVILFFICIHNIGYSQQIPNGNFEYWIQDSSYYISPKNWELQNGPELSLIQQAKGYHSQYSICMNVAWDDLLKKFCGATITNNFNITPQIKYSFVRGYIKGSSGNTDTLIFTVNMYNNLEMVGSGTGKMFNTSLDWSEFAIPINYLSKKKPDRVFISISINSANGSYRLTTYYIDSLTLALIPRNNIYCRFI